MDTDMKKLVCLLMGMIAQAASALSAADHTFTGVYLTGGVGASGVKFNAKQDIENVTSVPFSLSIAQENDYHARSASGLVGLGYMYQFQNPFVLGFEATAGYMDAQQTDDTVLHEELFFPGPTVVHIDIATQINAKLTNDFALLLKPGFVLHKRTLVYGFVGPRWGNFETSSSTLFHFQLNTETPLDSSGADKVSGYELGVTAGAGIQQMLTDHFHLSLEYAYTSYGDINTPSTLADITLGTPIPGAKISADNTVTVATNTAMLALSYQW
jgi:opacity protein-like surface antigen